VKIFTDSPGGYHLHDKCIGCKPLFYTGVKKGKNWTALQCDRDAFNVGKK